MKYLLILLLLPAFGYSQRVVYDSVVVTTPTGQKIRFTQPIDYVTAEAGDSIFVRNTTTKKRALLSQLSLPISTATQAALDLKASASAIPTTTSQLTNNSGFLTGTSAIGYTAGAGGTVTQNANKTTGVTLNKLSGQIVMNGAALAAAAEVAFTLTNSFIAATDVVIVNIQSVGTAGAYLVSVGAVAAGSCSITVSNASAGSLSQAVVLNFAIIKSVAN